jgi:hypothetical protein
MKLSSTLRAALLSGTIAFTGTACQPTQDKHNKEVSRILDSVHPTEDAILRAREYYQSRENLENLSDAEFTSLIFGNAKMTVLARRMQDHTISIADFLMILKSEDQIITDKNTKLKISTTF